MTENPSRPVTYEHYADSGFLVNPVGEPLGLQDRTIDVQKPPSSPEKRRYYELCVEGVLVPISYQQLLSMDIMVHDPFEPYVKPFFLCDYGRLQFAAWLEEECPTGLPESTFYCLRMMRHVGRTSRYMALVLHCVDQARQLYERVCPGKPVSIGEVRYRREQEDLDTILVARSKCRE